MRDEDTRHRVVRLAEARLLVEKTALSNALFDAMTDLDLLCSAASSGAGDLARLERLLGNVEASVAIVRGSYERAMVRLAQLRYLDDVQARRR